MIGWTAPAALAALALLAGPILVHMLLRRSARRVVFPTTRFLQPTTAAAVRFRRPSDPGLLLLRLAIVVAAVLAAAQPVILSPWRTARWNTRIARAVILDSSRSVPSPAEASRLADQELAAFAAIKFATDDLDDGVLRAVQWLEHVPPARREIVIVSDFQRGALSNKAVRSIPASVGLRFIRAGRLPDTRAARLPPISGWRGDVWEPTATLRDDRIDSAWQRRGSAEVTWLTTRQAAADAGAAARAVAGAASFGIAAGDDSHKVIVTFQGASSLPRETVVATPWMLQATLLLHQSELLREAAADVATAEQDGAFVVHANVPATSGAAPAVVRAVMLAVRPPRIADAEAETSVLSDAELAAWRREPAPLGPVSDVSVSDGLEARALWAIALALLAAETWVRRTRRSKVEQEAHADAA